MLHLVRCNRYSQLHNGIDITGWEKGFIANDDVIEKWNCWIKQQKMVHTLEGWCQSPDLVLVGKKSLAFIDNKYISGQSQGDQLIQDIVFNEADGLQSKIPVGDTNATSSMMDPGMKPKKIMVDEILSLLLMLFVDLVKAFSTIKHELLFQILSKYSPPKELINAVKKLYKNSKVKLTIREISKQINYETGGVQQVISWCQYSSFS